MIIMNTEFVDVLLNLFDLSGFFDSSTSYANNNNINENENDNDKKLILSSLLRRLALFLQQDSSSRSFLNSGNHNATCTTSGLAAGDDEGDESNKNKILLDVENTVTKLRVAICSYQNDILPKEKMEIFACCQSLETLSATTATTTIPWILLVRSLCTSLQNQIHTKKNNILNEIVIKVLDTLYGDTNENNNHDENNNNNNNNQNKINLLYTAIDILENRMSYMEALCTDYKQAALILQEHLSNNNNNELPQKLNNASKQIDQACFFESNNRITITDRISAAAASSTTTTATTPCWCSLSITKELSIDGAIKAFFNNNNKNDFDTTTTFLLVHGPEGSGKTNICDKAERSARRESDADVRVLRPRIPLDFLGKSVGDTENSIISVLCAAYSYCCGRHRRRVLVILDDIDHILLSTSTTHNQQQQDSRTDNQSGVGESHMMKRSRATFLNMMDVGRNRWSGYGTSEASSVLVLCTSRNSLGGSLASRFDRTYYLDLPREADLREMVIETLGLTEKDILDNDDDDSGLGSLLASVVQSCVGKSYAEIAQYCRDAVDSVSRRNHGVVDCDGISEAVLKSLKSRLMSITPASLRDTILDDQIDLRVMSVADLGVAVSTDGGGSIGGYELPLQGESAVKAWKALESSIVIPLCRSPELSDLLYGGNKSGSQRMVTGGVLISGPSGSGKSSIALHCAKYAASLLPSLKVLDVSCTSLIHKEVGGSERAVHHLFDAARRAAPCIVMMDGIENIAAVRGNDTTTEGTMDRVLSTLLVELDGDDTQRWPNSHQHGGIAVIGITPNDLWVDPAVKRPGRLEKVVRMEVDWV